MSRWTSDAAVSRSHSQPVADAFGQERRLLDVLLVIVADAERIACGRQLSIVP
jgi:hypothetical protein